MVELHAFNLSLKLLGAPLLVRSLRQHFLLDFFNLILYVIETPLLTFLHLNHHLLNLLELLEVVRLHLLNLLLLRHQHVHPEATLRFVIVVAAEERVLHLLA